MAIISALSGAITEAATLGSISTPSALKLSSPNFIKLKNVVADDDDREAFNGLLDF